MALFFFSSQKFSYLTSTFFFIFWKFKAFKEFKFSTYLKLRADELTFSWSFKDFKRKFLVSFAMFSGVWVPWSQTLFPSLWWECVEVLTSAHLKQGIFYHVRQGPYTYTLYIESSIFHICKPRIEKFIIFSRRASCFVQRIRHWFKNK